MVRDRFFNTWCLMRSGGPWRQQLADLVEVLDIFFHPYRAEDSRTRRIWNLLVNLKASNGTELASMSMEPVAGQEELFGKVKEGALFRAYLRRDLAEAKMRAQDFWGVISLFVRVVRARTFEDSGELDDALEEIEQILRSSQALPETQRQWLDLERIRLLGRLARVHDATPLLAGLLNRESLPAADLALELVEIAKCDPTLAGISGLLLDAAEKRAPKDIGFLTIRSEMAWAAKNTSLAIEKLTGALSAIDPETPKSAKAAVLTIVLRFADQEPQKVGDALVASGLHQKWMPVALALEVLATGDPEKLSVLAPETATITELVLARIGSPVVPGPMRTPG